MQTIIESRGVIKLAKYIIYLGTLGTTTITDIVTS